MNHINKLKNRKSDMGGRNNPRIAVSKAIDDTKVIDMRNG